jgi:hypothetical protein
MKKNIHLIPTYKPSRLGYLTKKGKEVYKDLRLFDKLMPIILDSENQHIYITSDSEIKEGDWCYYLNNAGGNIVCQAYKHPNDERMLFDDGNRNRKIGEGITPIDGDCKKIILTTDSILIEDGIQEIPMDFLEWFVKNPSCEEVEVADLWKDGNPSTHYSYQIIIPQEEPKQETLQEAAENYIKGDDLTTFSQRAFFIAGAKWMQERMYNGDDMKQFAFQCVANFLSNNENKVEMNLVDVIIDRLNNEFEQFKK